MIICNTIDVVGLYPNIPHEEGLASSRKHINRENKEVTTDIWVKLADIVLKNKYFQSLDKAFKQEWKTAGTNFAPPCSILFVAGLEEHLRCDIDLRSYIWLRYIDDIFPIWEHGEESLKFFLQKINSIHREIKFTADWSYSLVNLRDVNVIPRRYNTKYCIFVAILKDEKIISDFVYKT